MLQFRNCHYSNIPAQGQLCVFENDLDVSVHGGGLSRPDQPLQLCTAVVLSLGRQFLDVDIGSEQVEASHLVGVDGEDLDTPLLIRQTWGWRRAEEEEEEEGWIEKMTGKGKERKRESIKV